jgi:hypothetical protein
MKKLYTTKYDELCDKMKGNMRIEPPRIDPIMRSMTVYGQSGPGTSFANEYERLMHNHINPPNPSFITYHTLRGIIYIYPKKTP